MPVTGPETEIIIEPPPAVEPHIVVAVPTVEDVIIVVEVE